MKKGEFSRPRDDHKEKSEKHPIDGNGSYNRLQSTIWEIKMISGVSFKSLRKSQQRFVNSVHGIPPLK